MGRCSRDIHAHLLGDLLTVRLQGVLTAAEQRLVRMRVTSDIAAASWRIASRLCHQILKMGACVRGQSDSPLVGKQLGDVGQEWGTPSDNSFPPTGGRFGFDAKPLVRRTCGLLPSSQDSDSDRPLHLRGRCHHCDCTAGDRHWVRCQPRRACPELASNIRLIGHADNIHADWRPALPAPVKSTDARKRFAVEYFRVQQIPLQRAGGGEAFGHLGRCACACPKSRDSFSETCTNVYFPLETTSHFHKLNP